MTILSHVDPSCHSGTTTIRLSCLCRRAKLKELARLDGISDVIEMFQISTHGDSWFAHHTLSSDVQTWKTREGCGLLNSSRTFWDRKLLPDFLGSQNAIPAWLSGLLGRKLAPGKLALHSRMLQDSRMQADHHGLDEFFR